MVSFFGTKFFESVTKKYIKVGLKRKFFLNV